MNSKKELLMTSILAIGLALGLGTISYGLFSEIPINARVDVLAEKNGVRSVSFLPSDLVLLEAQLSYGNSSLAGTPVEFGVRTPDGTDFPLQKATTNNLGTANITFTIPWPSSFSLGTWWVSVASEVYGQTLNASTSFECQLLPIAVDISTQKSGVGQNAQGGHFALNETVDLYAQVRDELNRTLPNQDVSFVIKDLNGTSFDYGTLTTDSSGFAGTKIGIRQDEAYVGTFEVYARTVYNDVVLLDTLTFRVEA